MDDINTRTGELYDYIIDDTLYRMINDQFDYITDDLNIWRKSIDKTVNCIGVSLTNLCCNLNIHVLNGRFQHNYEGEYTCPSNDGRSLVDNMIASSEILTDCVNYFQVDMCDISDHYPLHCSCSGFVCNNSRTVQSSKLMKDPVICTSISNWMIDIWNPL